MIYATSLLACLLSPTPAVNGPIAGHAFEAPVALTADGVLIDVGKDIGHAGPHLRDYNGDGKTDLLVSTFRGTISVFLNVGTNSEPAYQAAGRVQAVGDKPTDLKFHNW